MASQRRAGEPETVNPMVDGGPTEGVSTLDGMFSQQPTVVDEVQEVPLQMPQQDLGWVIRPNCEIEDMTVGNPHHHLSFKEGTRYRVPIEVAEILYNREKLMEVPYPYEPQRR